MDGSAQDICTWLDANRDKQLTIEKTEQRDVDHIEMQIDDIGLLDYAETADEYLYPMAIILKGAGSIATQDGRTEQLPEESYEIPLSKDFQCEQTENGVAIRTDRAQYTISVH
ncbi:hypothetical protein [Paenibacillus hexagrammi]|uniref:Uncharacterized protein n=1 Tax=Paenibacillus hexagrammi TaxID=2908839 RepID=A0ABY3SGV1_9BACL|nr:hypothetical protein [Paenibacillus sp. YPD9-1]UJF32713.1 hypothetical protein L0M14_24335 [Paenibacillus sp. YPD9-1]